MSSTTTCNNTEPAVNWKCIVITMILAGGYWFLPRNKWILLAIVYFTYLAIAWYDYYYKCQRNMGPTYLAFFYKTFKPQESEQIVAYNNWCPDLKRQVLIVDLIILGILIAFLPRFLKWQPMKTSPFSS
jgi:hypothetical protein